MHLDGGHAQHFAHHVIGFADQLHVTVFNAVVDHFDKVARAAVTNPVATGHAAIHFNIHLGGDGLKDRLDGWPCGARSARHDARPQQRALFATGHASTNVQQAQCFQPIESPRGVGKMRVAAVDEDVAFGKQRSQRLQDVVHRLASGHHQHDFSWAAQRFNQCLQRVTARNRFAVRPACGELVNPFA